MRGLSARARARSDGASIMAPRSQVVDLYHDDDGAAGVMGEINDRAGRHRLAQHCEPHAMHDAGKRRRLARAVPKNERLVDAVGVDDSDEAEIVAHLEAI